MAAHFGAPGAIAQQRLVMAWVLPVSVLGAFVPLVCPGAIGAIGGVAAALAVVIVGAVISSWLRRTPRFRMGRVEVDDRGLLLDGRLVVARGALAMGLCVPVPSAAAVLRLYRRGRVTRPINVAVEDGRALLAALELDASRRSFSVPVTVALVASGALGPLAACVVASPLIFFLVPESWSVPMRLGCLVAVSILVVGAILWRFTAGELEIGNDGICVSMRGGSTFCAYSELESVAVQGIDLVIRRRRVGEAVRPPLRFGLDSSYTHGPGGRLAAAALLARISEMRAPFARGSSDCRPDPLNLAEDPSERHWIARLRELVGAPGYRRAGVDCEQFWRLVEDPAERSSRRAGAAIVLAMAVEVADRRRLQAVAGASASPALRRVIECAAADIADLDSMADALAALRRDEACPV